jgi:hypothetical protein
MAISRVAGQMLKDVLERDGIDISYANANVGINTASPTERLEVVGNVKGDWFLGNVSTTGNIVAGNISANVVNLGNLFGGNAIFTDNVTVVGTLTSTSNIVANLSGIFYGNAVTGVGAIFAGIPGFTPLPNTVIQVAGNAEPYVQINFENINGNGTTDYIATADAGTDITHYIDMGIAGSSYDNTTPTNSLGNVIGPLDAYLYNQGDGIGGAGGNLAIGTTEPGREIRIFTGGVNADSIVATVSNTGLAVVGNITTGNINISQDTISGLSDIIIDPTGNINVSGVNINNLAEPVANSDAATKFYVDTELGNVSANVIGNIIQLGTNSQGNLESNAVTLTTTTTITDGIALLNVVLGKLVPPAPTSFPGSPGTLAIASVSSYRMANITQTDNTPGANKNVAAGTTVSTVRRAATYTTNTFTNLGPGDSGTITAVRNGANVGTVTLNTGASPSGNGTYGGNLVITNNYDYNTANANIAAGFWYVFTSTISGSSAAPGWNEIYIADSAASNTSTAVWYYDNSSPSTPSFSSTTMAPSTTTLLYSSTIPHYTNATQFNIGTTVANVSGNLYPTSNTLSSGSAGGAFATPASVNYNASNVGSNILNSFQSASFTTTANITTGFGASATGPSLSVNNSYNTGTLTLTTALANTVLWKSGSATAIDEGNIVVTSVGTGSGNAVRIVNPGTGNTPAYTANASAFNSQSSTLQTYDATVVGSSTQGVLKHDQTNYSTGYLPAGPDLSSGRTGTQYFTFKFVRTDVSKFDITYAGNVAGMWVALPGSVIDSSSGANGWINMATAYAGAGYPGVNAPGNGSDGCALGGTVSLNTTVASTSKTCTFGTVSSSSTLTNEIYVRIALTSGQSVTGLSLKAASN